MFKLKFSHFWDNFDVKNNIFYELVQEIYQDVQVVTSKNNEIDLEITSTFSPKHQYFLKKIRKILSYDNQVNLSDKDFFRDTNLFKLNENSRQTIWFTGENIRPPVDSRINKFLSFDQDDYNGKNIYFPLWQFHLREKLSVYNSPQLGESFPTSNFMTVRDSRLVPSKFVCAFIGNLDPYRLRAIQALRVYGDVDIYGKRFGRFIKNKREVAKDYKFVLAFENDFFPGYVTEKLFDAYACDSIPLYWGDLGNEKLINRNAYINAANSLSLAEFAKKVGAISDSEWLSMYRQPLLKSLPDFQKIIEFLQGRP